MKKTLIAFVICAGSTIGATVAPIDLTDTSLQSYFDFSADNNQTSGIVDGWKELTTWNEAGEYGTTGSEHCMFIEGGGLSLQVKKSGGFTISYDICNPTKTGTILSLGYNMNNNWKHMKVTLNESASVTDGYTLSTTLGNVTLSSELGSITDWTTLTFVGTYLPSKENGEDRHWMTLSVYINGEQAQSSSVTAGDFVVNDVNKLQFGHWGAASSAGAIDIDNILIYNRALSESEIKALTIPEPATATLSLLALAGLAMRRRRK